ncbi:MAG: hypothetical protein ACAI44_36610, partial [Candidatus Sericytochromatia bacterium]
TQVSKMDRGTVGIEQAFMALNAAKDIDPTLQSLVIYHMDTKHLVALVPRLTDEQKLSLHEMMSAAFPDRKAVDKLEAAFDVASKKAISRHKELDGKLNKIQVELAGLQREQTGLLEPPAGKAPVSQRIKKDKELMEHFKKDFKDLQQPLSDTSEKIAESFIELGGMRSSQLTQKAAYLTDRVETLISGIDRMNPAQRQVLFDRVMKQDVMGDVSQDILKRLIASSTHDDGAELIGFARKIEAKARTMDISMTDKTTESMKTLAKTFKIKDSDYTKAETREGLRDRLTEIRLTLS